MILFFLITFIYGSNSVPLQKLSQISLANANDTKKSQSLLMTIKSNPKKFLSEAQNLDPEALRNVISLIEALLESSEARENHLIDDLSTKNNALGDANAAIVNAENALDAANQAVIDAQGVLSAKEQLAASAQSDLDTKRQTGAAKQAEKDASQGTHDDEIPGLNDEQQVLRDVIAMLEGLPDAQQWKTVAHVTGSTPANRAFWNSVCEPFGDLTTDSIILVHMGQIKDFFKPTSGMTLCHFLTHKEYTWSPHEDGDYMSVNMFNDHSHLGGSSGVPGNGDGRAHLAFWGYDDGRGLGGCCYSRSNIWGGSVDSGAWHQEFTVSVKKHG